MELLSIDLYELIRANGFIHSSSTMSVLSHVSPTFNGRREQQVREAPVTWALIFHIRSATQSHRLQSLHIYVL
jgi:hypothetical protein